jgi:hypothetical protein
MDGWKLRMSKVGCQKLAELGKAQSVHKAIFESGAPSTGWIDCEFQDGKRLFIPAKINTPF